MGQTFSFLHKVQTGSGSHPDSCSFSSEVKAPGREADRSPLTSTEVKIARISTSVPPYVFMA
jgi:hypothetical protein